MLGNLVVFARHYLKMASGRRRRSSQKAADTPLCPKSEAKSKFRNKQRPANQNASWCVKPVFKVARADRQRNEESKGKGRRLWQLLSSGVCWSSIRPIPLIAEPTKLALGKPHTSNECRCWKKWKQKRKATSLKLTDKGFEDLRKTEKKKKKKMKSAQRE